MTTMAFDPKNLQDNNESTFLGNDKANDANSDEATNGEEDYDEPVDSDNWDDSDSYGSSGEQYGWYNGWSDDVIDDAFEGDPENTWNVD